MKCPKCSYISFDFNDLCPKCGQDLSRERELMTFPSYKPTQLFLLGMLAGGSDESGSDSFMEQPEMAGAHGSETQELLISLENLSDERQDTIRLAPEPPQKPPETKPETEAMEAPDELAISLEDYSEEEEGPEASIQFEPEPLLPGLETMAPEEELSLSLEDLSDEEGPMPLEPETSEARSEPGMELKTEAAQPEEESAGAQEGFSLEEPDLVLFEAETESKPHTEEGPAEIVFEPETLLSEDAGSDLGDFWEKEAIEQRMADIQLDDLSQEEPPATEPQKESPDKEEAAEPDLFELELESLELEVDTETPGKKTT